jgi:hypothetical protein
MARRFLALAAIFALCVLLLVPSAVRAADLILDFRFPPIVLPSGFSLNLNIPCNVGIEPFGTTNALRAYGDHNCLGVPGGGIAVQASVVFDSVYYVSEVEFGPAAPDFDGNRGFTLSVVLPDGSEIKRYHQNYQLAGPRRVPVGRYLPNLWVYVHTGSFSGLRSLWLVSLRVTGNFTDVPVASPTPSVTFTPSATPIIPTNTPFVGAWLLTRAATSLPVCPNTPTPTTTRVIGGTVYRLPTRTPTLPSTPTATLPAGGGGGELFGGGGGGYDLMGVPGGGDPDPTATRTPTATFTPSLTPTAHCVPKHLAGSRPIYDYPMVVDLDFGAIVSEVCILIVPLIDIPQTITLVSLPVVGDVTFTVPLFGGLHIDEHQLCFRLRQFKFAFLGADVTWAVSALLALLAVRFVQFYRREL